MCWSSDMSEERMNPRLRAESEKVMSAFPTRIEEGFVFEEKDLLVWMRRTSVLSSFNFSLCVVIQVLMSVMQFCVVWMVWSMMEGVHDL